MALPSLAAVLSAFVFVLPTLAVLSSQAVVPWLLAATAAGALAAWRRHGWRPRLDRPLAGLLAAVVLWQAAASLWGFDVGGALYLALRVAVLAAAGLVLWQLAGALGAAERARVQRWLLAGFALGAAVMAGELAFDQPLYRLYMPLDESATLRLSKLNRGATMLAMLVWPATAVAWRHAGRWALAVPPAILALIAQSESMAAGLALAAGAAAAGLARLHRRAGLAALAAALALGVAGAPFVGPSLAAAGLDQSELMPRNGRARIHIWSFAARRIAERPLVGWGFDASRDMPNFGTEPYFEGFADVIPLHPHNGAVQVWLELGAVGAAGVLAVLALVLRRLEAWPQRERVLAQGAYASTLTVALAAYGLWQNQWLAAIFATAAAVLLARAGPAEAPAPVGASDMDSRRARV